MMTPLPRGRELLQEGLHPAPEWCALPGLEGLLPSLSQNWYGLFVVCVCSSLLGVVIYCFCAAVAAVAAVLLGLI